MNKNNWAYLCWPGLLPLWQQGAVSGFLLAFGAGLLLNLLLLSTFVYTEMLQPQVRNYGWLSLVVVWVASGVGSYWWQRWNRFRSQRTNQNDLLASASVEYLRGNWYQAELSLWQALKHDRRDVDALLMLATICRHTNRLDEAERKLDELVLLERSSKWKAEIAQERKLIAQKRAALTSDTSSDETNFDTEASNQSKPTDELTYQRLPMGALVPGELISSQAVNTASPRAA